MVELIIYLHFVASETRNVETVTKQVTLLKYAYPKNNLNNNCKLYRDIIACCDVSVELVAEVVLKICTVGYVSNFSNVQPLNKLDK